MTGQNALAVIERPTKRSAMVAYNPSEEDQRLQSNQGISGLFVVEYDIDRKSDAGDVLVNNLSFLENDNCTLNLTVFDNHFINAVIRPKYY